MSTDEGDSDGVVGSGPGGGSSCGKILGWNHVVYSNRAGVTVL